MGALLLVAVFLSSTAIWFVSDAQACGTIDDGKHFRRDLSRRMRCEFKRSLGLPLQCHDPQAVCSVELDELASVVQGASGSLACIRELYRQPRSYYRRRYRELRHERRAASEATRFVERIRDRCAGETLSLGGACQGLTDPGKASYCLRALTESLVQTASGLTVRPNLVLVLTDDQRWDTLWAMPLLESLVVARGIEFTNSFTSTSLCCPDRASIFTGQYAHNHGVTSNQGAALFDHDGDTIQRQLQENAGYRTALVGKYMVRAGTALQGQAAPGWDEWHVFYDDGGHGSTHGLYYNYRLSTNGQVDGYAPLDESGEPTQRYDYSTDLLRDRALGLIDTWRAEPFFIEYAPFAPHTPPIPADRHIGFFAGIPLHRPPSYLEADLTDKPLWVSFWRGILLVAGLNAPQVDARRVSMLETLLAVDEAIAAISAKLEAHGLTDNTLLAFTSDNGFALLEHWWTSKNVPYEESIRVPLAVRYPVRVPAARQVSELVQPIDFYPTFAELAGISGAAVNGRSLVPLLDGDASGWRQEILIEHFGAGLLDPSTGIRTQDWKLIRTDAPVGVTLELYDMQNDPFELTNVAGLPAHAGLIATLSAQLDLLEQE